MLTFKFKVIIYLLTYSNQYTLKKLYIINLHVEQSEVFNRYVEQEKQLVAEVQFKQYFEHEAHYFLVVL